MKKRTLTKGMLMAALICGCVQWGGTAVHAEELQEFTLDQYVVTATRTEKKIIDVPASVNVITAKDIEISGAVNVDDVLKRVPGVTVSRTSGIGNSKPEVTMRGVKGGKYVLVLVDGQPMVNAYSGTVNWNDIPVESIEKIEVVKGPASSIYGSNAMAGVISITTKDSKKFHGSTSLTYGSNNTWIRKINVGDKVDKFSYDLYYQGTDSDGYGDHVSATVSNGTGDKTASGYKFVPNSTGTGQKAIYGEKGERNWNEDSYSGKFAYKFDDNKSLSIGFHRNKSDYKYDYNSRQNWLGTTGKIDVGNGKYFETKDRDFAGAPGFVDDRVYTLSYKDDDNKLNIVAGLTDNRSWNGGKYTDFNYYSAFTYYDSKRYNLGVNKEIDLSDNDIAVIGVQYVYDKMDKVKYNPKSGNTTGLVDELSEAGGGKAETYAVYFQNEHKFSDKFSVIGALRYDRWTVKDGYVYTSNGLDDHPESKTESELSPKIALNYKFDDTQSSYISWGKAFAAPSLYDMFSGTVDGYGESNEAKRKVTIPNPALSPQIIETIETGWKKSFNNKTDVEIAVYHNKITDIAYKGATGNIRYIDGLSYREEQQVAGAEGETDGIEIGINHRFDNKLSAFANITFQNPTITKSTSKTEVDKLVRNTPKRLFSIGVDYVDSKFMGQLAGNYYSKKYSNADNSDIATGTPGGYDPTFVLNLNTIYKFDKNHSMQFAINNLLDREYYNYNLAPGREYMFTYTYSF